MDLAQKRNKSCIGNSVGRIFQKSLLFFTFLLKNLTLSVCPFKCYNNLCNIAQFA